MVKKVIDGLYDTDNVFRNYTGLDCFNCSSCQYPEHCLYPENEKLYMRLKDIYAAVLVNEATISSAEILAGTIQHSKSGVLIGTNTFGKADVQSEFPILSYKAFLESRKITGDEIADARELKEKYGLRPDSSGIIGSAHITVAKCIVPGQEALDDTGFKPDIYVGDSELIKDLALYGAHKMDKTAEYGIGDESENILCAKVILKAAGYNAGTINKILDSTMLAAISQFQADKCLDISYTLDIPTQEVLNCLLESLVFQKDDQLKRAVEYFTQQGTVPEMSPE